LQATCAPGCNPHDVDGIATLYDIGWVSAGVGAASLVTALLLWRPWEHATNTTAQSVFVAPSLGGVTVGGVIQ
jgi:hypothetical protein